ncbi:peptidase A24 [Methylosinus sp. R-45379]|uniref:prepilin peptidase n=1 Tax=unclassified Methylosinus TaxID=2624500 RepID=UPI000465C224|nr:MULTISPECIES: prepilin peptidase [unclassified Methylosinus]OAI25736.1 peptidase A24 [Methylosinus sp. R-45379]
MNVPARRRAALVETAIRAATARGEGRALAHVVWIALAALAFAFLDLAQLGYWAAPTLVLFAALAFASVFDARFLIIPDGPLIVLLLLGLALLPSDGEEAALRLAGAAGGYATLRAIDMSYRLLRGRAGLGLADAHLLGLAGLWLGPAALPGCLLIAVVSAFLSALIAARDGALGHMAQPIPFGPHLALGFWLCWSLGPLEAAQSGF